MKKITVIIPSRKQPSQIRFLKNAINSIKSQSIIKNYDVEVIICLDKGQEITGLEEENLKIKFAESSKQG